MGEFPEQLPGESDTAYAHFCAWLRFPTPDNTAAFAADRGITPQYVRKLRSTWNWADRRRPIVAETEARTTELAVEKVAASRAERLAAAIDRNEAAYVVLQGKVLEQALAAAEQLPNMTLGAAELLRLLTVALQHTVKPAAAQAASVQVTTDGRGAVDVRVASLEGLPAEQQAARAREIVEESARQVNLVEAYYRQQESA